MSLQEAYQAYQKKDLPTARRLVEEAIQADPNSEPAWVLKMIVAEHGFEREAAMQRVLALNPKNETALKYQASLKTGTPAANPAATAPAEAAAPKPPKPKPDPAAASGGTYEMLWDCESCGTKGLLGLTHRFCPNCGAVQNPDKRYFPSDDEKVAVKDHVFYGTDVTCAACDTLNNAQSHFCTNCGAPLEEGKKAATRGSETRSAGGKFEGGKSRDLVKEKHDAEMARVNAGAVAKAGLLAKVFSRTGLVCGGLLTLVMTVCGIIAALTVWTKQTSAVVVSNTWQREIKIEAFLARDEGDWCDSMPSDAYSVSRSQKERTTRQVADGQECHTVRVDNGDGTYSEREECTTRYRDEPVYDSYCEYTVDRWGYARSVTTKGNNLADVPAWPTFDLQGGTGYGREREGDHVEKYVVKLRDTDGKTHDCEFGSQSKWQSFTVESRWTADKGVIAGNFDCDSLKPAN